MSRVLVTGASGFVGRNVVAALAAAGHDVHAVARHRGEPHERVSWHEADLLAGGERVVGEVAPEVLVHLAWCAEHGSFWTSPENIRWVQASLSLLTAFADAGGRRAVLAGSCAEYQWSRERYAEDAPLVPSTLYGAAKHGLHVVADALARERGLSFAWGRVFFLYGPFEAPGRFVPSLVVPLLQRRPAPMTAGTQRRDFMHVADAGGAFAALADSPVTGAVNVASGDALTLREIAERIAARLDAQQLLQVGARELPAGDPPALVADVRRLHDEVGWRPSIDLDDGLDAAIGWWRARLAAEPSPR